MILFVVSALALGQTLEIGGTCPGSVSVEISDLTPGGGTLALAGTPGVGLLPEGSACEGLGIGLARPWSAIGPVEDSDMDGTETVVVGTSARQCSQLVVAIDLESCTATDPAPLTGTSTRCDGPDAHITSPADLEAYVGCTELDSLYLHQTEGVSVVSLPNLRTVHQTVYFHQNSALVQVHLPQLESVGESVYFHENLELRRIELRSLETVGSYVYLHGNSRLAKARMDGLAEVAEYVSITENGPLCLPDLDWGSISDSVSVDAPVCAG